MLMQHLTDGALTLVTLTGLAVWCLIGGRLARDLYGHVRDWRARRSVKRPTVN